jgi:hypothetical protein
MFGLASLSHLLSCRCVEHSEATGSDPKIGQFGIAGADVIKAQEMWTEL